jgi:hypothetical protein
MTDQVIFRNIHDEIKIDTTLVSAAAKPAECDEEAPREFETPQKSSAIVIKLTSESKGILFEKFPILYDNLGPEHIEVISKPNSQQLEQAKKSGLLGKEFQIKVTGYIKDEKGQLVTVEVPGAEFSEGLIPHILISTAKGVKQSYSKELAVGKVEPVNMQSLSGIMWWK